ncbi:MAG: nitroreductase family deazaflavin-dependent oxidoreductase [Thermoleophilaceae bacterium]|nr:nitroreductase family deazaflavin-dependent oxidoreductase [Thermoleophilaceae bacterium]
MEGPLPEVDPASFSSPFVQRMTKVAMSKPGTWFYMNVGARIDPFLMRVSRGRVDSGLGLMPVCVLTVKGAKSGIERRIQLVYFTDDGDPILMASSFGRPKHPAWYHNVKAASSVSLEAGGRSGRYRAVETEGAERERLYELAKQIYAGYGIYEQRASAVGRTVPVLRMK